MNWRMRLGALLGAGGLVMLAASAVVAAPPTYTIDVTKTADPAVVPPSGGDVEYTVWVENTGTGFFQTVVIDDGMAGCTLTGPTGDDGDGKLEGGETWAYTCTVSGVTPGTQNTATVNACHDLSACVAVHDATDQGSVTVGTGSATEAPPTEAPPTEAPPTEAPPTEAPPTEAPPTEAPPTEAPPTEAPPTEAPPTEAPPTEAPPTEAPPTEAPPTVPVVGTPSPTDDVAGITAPTTDSELGDLVRGPQNSLLLVIALGMLLASLVLVTPARPASARSERER